jgi:hypothetical protein
VGDNRIGHAHVIVAQGGKGGEVRGVWAIGVAIICVGAFLYETAPLVSSGTLLITNVPPGATVLVDGRERNPGGQPNQVSVGGLKYGPHVVTVTTPGARLSQTIDLKPFRSAKLDLSNALSIPSGLPSPLGQTQPDIGEGADASVGSVAGASPSSGLAGLLTNGASERLYTWPGERHDRYCYGRNAKVTLRKDGSFRFSFSQHPEGITDEKEYAWATYFKFLDDRGVVVWNPRGLVTNVMSRAQSGTVDVDREMEDFDVSVYPRIATVEFTAQCVVVSRPEAGATAP